MKNIAIITARSGSKGLKDKNIKELCGKPLLSYSIECALESGRFDKVFVSTDSPRYAEIAERYGADASFLRSAKTSGDTAGSWDVVREVPGEPGSNYGAPEQGSMPKGKGQNLCKLWFRVTL